MAAIIEFVGLPGVGKTTVSRKAAEELSAREIPVSEPTQELEVRPGLDRVLSKARFAATSFLLNPGIGVAQSRAVLGTDQQSATDFVRVLFNLLYITGVMTTHSSDDGACLLDQGLYQGVWSVGFRSSDEWSEILERFSKLLRGVRPDLVVFVEADEAIIADRLHERSDGDTRFEPGSCAFERGIDSYEQLKSHVQSAENGPRSIVIENETRDALQPNAIRIVDEIQTLNDQP